MDAGSHSLAVAAASRTTSGAVLGEVAQLVASATFDVGSGALLGAIGDTVTILATVAAGVRVDTRLGAVWGMSATSDPPHGRQRTSSTVPFLTAVVAANRGSFVRWLDPLLLAVLGRMTEFFT